MKRNHRYGLLSLIIIGLLFSSLISPAYAWGENTSEEYEQAIVLLKESKFAEAADAFRKLGSYADARRYVMYCEAVVAGEAKLYATAVTNFSSLDEFLDSAQLSVYYAGLSWEASEDYEKAADVLSAISLYYDVSERIAGYPALILARDYRLADEAEQVGNLEKALKGFSDLGEYSDSAARAEAVQQKIYARDYAAADTAEKEEKLEEALKGFTTLGKYSDSAARAEAVQQKIYARDYAAADTAEQKNELEEALSGFTALVDYQDSKDRAVAVREKINERDYQKAVSLETSKEYAAAYELFVGLGDYKDSASRAQVLQAPVNYAKGQTLIAEGKYKEAYTIFEQLGEYEDSSSKAYMLGISNFASLNTVAPGIATYEFHDSYGFVNYNEGILIAPQWSDVRSMSEDRLAVRSDGKYGVLDMLGNLISDYRWTDISNFNADGICTIATEVGSGWSAVTRFGLMDRDGKILTACNWTEIGDSSYSARIPMFDDGRIKVRNENKKWGFVAEDGSTAVSAVYDDCKDFSNGLAAVKSGEKWGFIDQNNQLVIAFRYQEVSSFTSDGTADVCRDGVWQIVDKTGNLVYFKTASTPVQTESAQAEEQKLIERIVAKLVSNEMEKATCESLIPLLLEGEQSKVRALLKPWLDKQNWKVNEEIFEFVERCYNGDCKFSSVWEIAETIGVQ